MNQIKEITDVEKNIISIATIKERSKGREETRIVSVSNVLTGISTEWIGLKSITKTERIVVEKNTERKETAYHISSLSVDAFAFNIGIRNHWGIENRLHYVKDVTFEEDASKINTKNAPENFSLIRNITINIYRKKGYKGMKQAIRLNSNDIQSLAKLLE